MCLISFIIPIYNCRSTISRCVKSITDSTFQDYEIIFIDDCSTDGSHEYCASMEALHPFVRSYSTKSNCGPGAARNLGMTFARGEFIFFIDADDKLESAALPLLAKSLRNNPDVDLFCTDYSLIWPDGTGRPKRLDFPECRVSKAILLDAYPDKPYTGVWTCGFKRHFLETYGIRFSETYLFEDFIFLTHAYFHARYVLLIPHVFYHYCGFMSDSLSNSPRLDKAIDGFSHYIRFLHELCIKQDTKAKWINIGREKAIVNLLAKCPVNFVINQVDKLESDGVAISQKTDEEILVRYGVPGYIAQWARNLYALLNDYSLGFRKRVYLCPASIFALTLARLFAQWSGKPFSFADNNPSHKNLHVVLCRTAGFPVEPIQEIINNKNGFLLLYHFNYSVLHALKLQAQENALCKNIDYFVIYDI